MTKFILRYRYFILAFMILGLYLIHSKKIKDAVNGLEDNNTGKKNNTGGSNETDSDPILNNSQVLFITTDVNEISVSVSGGKIYPAGTTVRMIDDTNPIWWYVRTPDGLEGYMLASYISK